MKYAYRMRQGPKTIARATLNDLPYYREPSNRFRDTASAADHLLVPGDNVLTLDVWEGPLSPDSPEHQGPVDLTVQVVATEAYLARIAWPAMAMAAGQPLDALEMPYRFSVKFTIPEAHPRPIYEHNPPEIIPEEGTQDLHFAVKRIQDALINGDARGFVTASGLKLREQERFYGPSPEIEFEGLIQKYKGRFEGGLDVEPIGAGDLRFEARSKSRAAYVTRKDGRPVFMARSKTNPGGSFTMDPVFVRENGTWELLL